MATSPNSKSYGADSIKVLKGLDAGSPVVYAPPIWRAVMTAIKVLPRFAMRRIKF